MQSTIDLGLAGFGGIGKVLARGFRDTDGAEIVAVTDVSERNLAAAGKELDVPEAHRYEDYKAMLDSEDLDGVAIATPHAFHYEQTVAALERGIDTLCEKPLCIDSGNATDLVRRSNESEAKLMVGYQRHLDPAFVTVREALREQVGEPQFITAEVTQNWISNQRDTWRGDPDCSGGGQLYDTGSHLLDVVLWTSGLTPETVDAQMLFDDEDRRVDKQAALTIQFENGAVASIAVSGDTPCVREHLHVWGDKGSAFVYGEDWDLRELRFVEEDGSEVHPNLNRHEVREKPETFVEVVRGDTEVPATPEDALAVTAVTEAAYESARTGERVTLDL